MLHVKPVIGTECEDFLRSEGVDGFCVSGVDVALYEDEKIIGAARISFEPDTAVLEGVYVTPDSRGNGFGDFLTRAVMDAYTRSLPLFRVAYKSEYFIKFGFAESADGMQIVSEEIKFPSLCGGHK